MRVLAVVGATENTINGSAMKPGDIVRAMTGTTIEVNNTDAEGRLVLCDCLAYAVAQGAERIVDVATLTGGIVTALGSTYAGLFATDEELAAAVTAAGRGRGRDRVADAAARRVRRADEGPLRRPRRTPTAARPTRSRAPRSSSASSATCRGRTSTSRAPATTTAAPTRPRAASGWGVRLLLELARAQVAAKA